jgi:putative FmdB family regulatory protein
MQTYEYHCKKCGHVFDRVETMSEHGDKKPACPSCKSHDVEPQMAAFFAKTSKKS